MPNTVSTPSFLRHSMMASTALTGENLLSGRVAGKKASLAGLYEQSFRETLVRPAAPADLVRHRHDPPAFVAFAARLVALVAVEDGGQRAEHRQHGADQEPEDERAALDLADHAGRQAEEERDDEVLRHGPLDGYLYSRRFSAQRMATTAAIATTVHKTADTIPMATLISTHAAIRRTPTARAFPPMLESAEPPRFSMFSLMHPLWQAGAAFDRG